MTREEAREVFEHNWTRIENPDYTEDELVEAMSMAIQALSAEPNKAVPSSLADVYKWERDIALSQLEEYGIGFAEKKRDDLVEVVRCKDCRFWKNEHLCLVMSRYGSIDTKAEHYCSWGERREP